MQVENVEPGGKTAEQEIGRALLHIRFSAVVGQVGLVGQNAGPLEFPVFPVHDEKTAPGRKSGTVRRVIPKSE